MSQILPSISKTNKTQIVTISQVSTFEPDRLNKMMLFQSVLRIAKDITSYKCEVPNGHHSYFTEWGIFDDKTFPWSSWIII